ncbi:MAG: RcpC/CpaB family pilus assembly protein [Gemmataceae bacterium]|nr:RcpC/CpaB family pilus assembly protein [Gemmataceae bacterium]MCS7270378.1 RcpC/CpaB family pilus assembly protein [Gemmataceae bacterium]MDW8243465.1 RcpC/CpaB family pilus assembly protein [Thermogemmata sp.]
MRASTVFALALALLIGLGAVAVAKYAGLFERKAASEPPPPPPLKVLVAKQNMFEGTTVMADQVMVRELQPDEAEALKARLGENWRARLLPPMPAAAALRVLKRNVLADQVLLQDFFEELSLPEELSRRLEPRTRAVNVEVPKSRAAGGQIRVGEYVDVFLTTEVSIGDREELRTACIARGCKVVMKRNTPWTVLMADPDDKPLSFTLQANPYRAALIEYASTRGKLSLLPAATPPKLPPGVFSDPSSPEYAQEDQRVDNILNGTLAISDADLMRIFNIQPPPPKGLPPGATVIHHLTGVKDAGYTIIPHGGSYHPATLPGVVPPNPNGTYNRDGSSPTSLPNLPTSGRDSMGRVSSLPATQPVSVSFRLPSATGGEKCKTCEEARRQAQARQ